MNFFIDLDFLNFWKFPDTFVDILLNKTNKYKYFSPTHINIYIVVKIAVKTLTSNN